MLLFSVGCSETDGDIDNKQKGVVFADGTEMKVEFNYEGGSKSFQFTSDVDWKLTVSNDWISVSPSRGTANDTKFTIEVEANDKSKERNGYVEMTTTSGQTHYIDVYQSFKEDVFSINDNGEYEVAADGGSVKVKVTTNIEYSVEIPSDAQSWLSVADTRATREETLTFTVLNNDSFDERVSTVKLVSKDGKELQKLVFLQKGVSELFSLSGNGTYNLDYNSTEVTVYVTTNLEYTISIPNEAKSWLTVVDTRVSTRTDEVVFAVTENESFSDREAKVVLEATNGKKLNLTFKQKALEVVFTLDKYEYQFTKEGGSVDVFVTANIPFDLEIESSALSYL